MTEQTAEQVPMRVECPAGKDRAIRHFIIGLGLIGVGIWCLNDAKPAPSEWTLAKVNEVAYYLFNNVSPYILMPGGALVIVLTAMGLRRKLVADADGIGYVGKEKIAWGQITEVDATKVGKGFLFLHAGDKSLTLDSWKLQNFRPLVGLIERHVPADKITR